MFMNLAYQSSMQNHHFDTKAIYYAFVSCSLQSSAKFGSMGWGRGRVRWHLRRSLRQTKRFENHDFSHKRFTKFSPFRCPCKASSPREREGETQVFINLYKSCLFICANIIGVLEGCYSLHYAKQVQGVSRYTMGK